MIVTEASSNTNTTKARLNHHSKKRVKREADERGTHCIQFPCIVFRETTYEVTENKFETSKCDVIYRCTLKKNCFKFL